MLLELLIPKLISGIPDHFMGRNWQKISNVQICTNKNHIQDTFLFKVVSKPHDGIDLRQFDAYVTSVTLEVTPSAPIGRANPQTHLGLTKKT